MRRLLVIITMALLCVVAVVSARAEDLVDRYVMNQPFTGGPSSLLDEQAELSPRAYGLDGSDYLWARWLQSKNAGPETAPSLEENLSGFLSRWGYLDAADTTKVRLPLGEGGMALAVGVEPAAPQGFGSDNGLHSPGVDVALELASGGLRTAPGIGWRNLDYTDKPLGYDHSATAWFAYLPVEYRNGTVTAKAGAYMGQNLDAGATGDYFAFGGPAGLPMWNDDGSISSSRVYGGYLALEYNIGHWSLAGGAGAVYTANDAWTKGMAYRMDSYLRRAYFLAVPYRLGGRLVVQPELSYFDNGVNPKDGSKIKDDWLLGVNMRFSF